MLGRVHEAHLWMIGQIVSDRWDVSDMRNEYIKIKQLVTFGVNNAMRYYA